MRVGDEARSREELLEEVRELRVRVKELESLERARERVEEKLRESEERFRFMAETTGDVLYRLRYSTMQYDYLSPSILKLTGYSRKEITSLGFSTLVINVESPGEKSLSMELIARHRREGKTGEFLADYLIRTKSGDQKWLGDHSFPWLDPSGNVVGSVGVLSDITKRKVAEEALKQMNQELQCLATSDGLTRVANRRKFDEFLRLEWRRVKREQGPIALIICDIDYFKLFNDTYGHQAGDDCLRTVAQAISQTVNRPNDLVARYGGEEFAVILSNTSAQGAIHVAENIRKNVQDLRIAHTGSQACQYVTTSCGVASMVPSEALLPDILIAFADIALYAAKEQGRNRVAFQEVPSLFPD
jgi:diguanylate cyclase (GGDEF)-like protein/PAS domain S-box-containing protein